MKDEHDYDHDYDIEDDDRRYLWAETKTKSIVPSLLLRVCEDIGFFKGSVQLQVFHPRQTRLCGTRVLHEVDFATNHGFRKLAARKP